MCVGGISMEEKNWLDGYRGKILELAQRVLACDSPSGYTGNVLKMTAALAEEMGYSTEISKRGALCIRVEGRDNHKTVACFAHMDTLGLSLRRITDRGELMFTAIGSPVLATLDGEYCRIYTREGKVHTGTILSLSPAKHVFLDASTRVRDDRNMYIRLDEPVVCKADVEALGIRCGDIICIDPKTEVTESGFLKSRFIDDKGGSACMLTLASILSGKKLTPKYNTLLFFSIYEEVGHGASYVPAEVSEVLAVDMGCIGLDLSCTEYDVSICAKDSSGPYDYDMTGKLIAFAEENKLSFAVDIYPQYGSDVSASLRGGSNIRGGLIGPGVHASHGMERTHWEGLKNTLALMLAYVEAE